MPQHKVQIGRLDGAVRDQQVPPGDHRGPVLARIDIRDCRDIGWIDRPARVGEQRGMQRALDHTSLGRRRELATRQIRLEEIVGHDQPATAIAVEEMMPAREPEVLHGAAAAPLWSEEPMTYHRAQRSGLVPRFRVIHLSTF